MSTVSHPAPGPGFAVIDFETTGLLPDAVVVAADPFTLSGKARKAREYGIPVVGEAWLRDLLGTP